MISETTVTVAGVEEYIKHLILAAKQGASNVPSVQKLSHSEYINAVEGIEYWRYVQCADYHYFVSRVLYVLHVIEYSNFSGQQCIENYFKAFLKFKNQVPPNSHELSLLLDESRSLSSGFDQFIKSSQVEVIVAKYAPFYELGRYPIQRTRPKGSYAYIIPDDIYILDYFVMKMREILAIPQNTWDILKKGHFSLFRCQQAFPDFYALFFKNNINFPHGSGSQSSPNCLTTG